MTAHTKRWQRSGAILVCFGLAAFFLGGVISADLSHAQRRFLREEWKLPSFYPKGFDGYGTIERIAEDEIVISDSLLKFARRCVYATPANRKSRLSAFRLGDTAAYLLNADGAIISLWLIK